MAAGIEGRFSILILGILMMLTGCEAFQPASERECDQAFERVKDLMLEEALEEGGSGNALVNMGLEYVMREVIDMVDDMEKEKFVRQCMGKRSRLEVRCMLAADELSELERCN